MTAREAARRLGVKPATLYAYVSRGLIRSAAMPDGRAHGYNAEDIERLRRARGRGRRKPSPLEPFDSITPVLDSALCLVEGGRLYYRGTDAVALAERASLEQVAQLLWQVEDHAVFAAAPPSPLVRRSLHGLPPVSAPIERARAVLGKLAAEDLSAVDVSPGALPRTGAALVQGLASAITGKVAAGMPVHQQLAEAWGLRPAGADLLRRCLVLVADHELNASTYVARCVASTGATLYAVALAALSALSGPRHGGSTSRVEALLGELIGSRDPNAALVEFIRRGELLPGFGHPLYPEGDPRAVAILHAMRAAVPSGRAASYLQLVAAAGNLISQAPNVDFALGTVAGALRLPRGSALGIFLIGRSVGWIAHAMEQYATGRLIRPRARYVGPLPKWDGADAPMRATPS